MKSLEITKWRNPDRIVASLIYPEPFAEADTLLSLFLFSFKLKLIIGDSVMILIGGWIS